jgi:hypothetical protein
MQWGTHFQRLEGSSFYGGGDEERMRSWGMVELEKRHHHLFPCLGYGIHNNGSFILLCHGRLKV